MLGGRAQGSGRTWARRRGSRQWSDLGSAVGLRAVVGPRFGGGREQCMGAGA